MTKRYLLFLRDTLFYTFTAFGGPQAHVAMMLKQFVKKRRYVTEEELLELNALSQVLPGPSSTQTLIGIAYKVGGLYLALLTFLVWVIPSATIMTLAAISYGLLDDKKKFTEVLKFIQPVAVGIVGYAAYSFGKKVLQVKSHVLLALGAIVATIVLRNAYVFPIAILIGGMISSAIETPKEETELRVKLFTNVNPKKVAYFIGILLLFAALGAIINQTSPFSLPIRLFENFYRNGIVIFGGGQVLVPLMFTEFVQMKQYLSSPEFLSGFALQQALPGPTFSFTSYVGALSMKNFGYDTLGQIMGGVVAVLGINLPGLILILFIVPFWDDLKKISRIKHSLSGINAVAVGFIVAAFLFLFQPLMLNALSVSMVIATFLLLNFTKVNTPILVIIGVALGLIF